MRLNRRQLAQCLTDLLTHALQAFGQPQFTIAFIPNEPLLAAALEKDPTLLEYAFSKRIALASPVSFWAVLKTVAFTWQQEVLTDEAKQAMAEYIATPYEERRAFIRDRAASIPGDPT